MSESKPLRDDEHLDALLRRASTSQQNLLPHDLLRNGVTVDDAVWNGFEKPTFVQKVGVLIFGGLYILCGIAIVLVIYEKDGASGALIGSLVGLVYVGAGTKVALNAFRKRKKKRLE